MNISFSLIAICLLLSLTADSQTQPLTSADIVTDSKAIMVVKVTAVGPVNIIGRSRTQADVIHVFKGDAIAKLDLSVRSRLKVGSYYLVVSPSLGSGGKGSPDPMDEEIIPIISEHEAHELKQFSPLIAVRRTINLRIGSLNSRIRGLTFELENLKRIRPSN